MGRRYIVYSWLLIILSTLGCNECRDEVCKGMPTDYFNFNVIDAQTGEDPIFGGNPINDPDSIQIQAQDERYVEANRKQKTLGFSAINDTFYILLDRRSLSTFPFSNDYYDMLYLEIQSLGMGECCEEYRITKVNFNDSIYYPDEKGYFLLKR